MNVYFFDGITVLSTLVGVRDAPQLDRVALFNAPTCILAEVTGRCGAPIGCVRVRPRHGPVWLDRVLGDGNRPRFRAETSLLICTEPTEVVAEDGAVPPFYIRTTAVRPDGRDVFVVFAHAPHHRAAVEEQCHAIFALGTAHPVFALPPMVVVVEPPPSS